MAETRPAIHLSDVQFRHGRHAVLQGVDLQVATGETVVLLGENGAGKSTLLRICLGTLRARSGRVEVLGLRPHKDEAKLHPRVGYVPDRPDAYGWMKPAEWFRFLAAHLPDWDAGRTDELAQRLALPMERRFKHMSRGEAMKTMLVGALGHDPDVLLLDEPFGGLDPFVREEILRHVIHSVEPGRRAILLTTHDLDVTARLADRVVMLADGRLHEHPGVAPEDGEETHTPAAIRDWAARQRPQGVLA